MAKRGYDRRGNFLVDEYEEIPGRKTVYQIPIEFLGEAPDEKAKEERLRELASEQTSGAVNWYGLVHENPPELLEIRLAQLATNNWAAPMALMRFLDDPRVRPALIAAARRVTVGELSNFAQVLGLIGGTDARQILRERLHEIEAMPQTFMFAKFSNNCASSLSVVASSLLGLDPDAIDAAQALIRLFEHPTPLDRHSSVRQAVSVFRQELSTEAMILLRTALEGLLDADDPEMFLPVAPLLARTHFEAVHQRCEEMLNGDDYELRQHAAVALSRIPAPYAAEALATLVRWVPQGEPLGLALWVASTVRPFVAESVMINLVRRGLASEPPTLRYEAMSVAEELPPDVARPLLEEALADEPDPALARKMRKALV